MEIRNNILFCFLFSLLTFINSSCQKKVMENKYTWLATVSAPKEFPIDVYTGELIANDFTYNFHHGWGTQNSGWGKSGGVVSVSTEFMEIPHTLNFTWYSWHENKFYSGEWKLD